MFRESDVPEKHLHKTFLTKPNPAWQVANSNARFDEEWNDGGGSRSLVHHEQEVPTTWDSRYNPEHPDADWCGLVSKNNQSRRHTNDHSSQRINLSHTEKGIMGQDDFVLPRRRRDGGAFNPITGEPVEQKQQPPLIAGTGAAQGADHWKTSYQRFVEREPTSRDMLTLKRQEEVKKVPSSGMPPHHGGVGGMGTRGVYQDGPTSYDSRVLLAMQQQASRERENTAPNSTSITGAGGLGRGPSLMGSLGGSLMSRVPEFERKQIQADPRSRPQTLLLENYSSKRAHHM
jgi:hypothetical protein